MKKRFELVQPLANGVPQLGEFVANAAYVECMRLKYAIRINQVHGMCGVGRVGIFRLNECRLSCIVITVMLNFDNIGQSVNYTKSPENSILRNLLKSMGCDGAETMTNPIIVTGTICPWLESGELDVIVL